MMKREILPLVDLFCGIGGFSEGWRMAGGRVLLAVDCWADALAVHEANHPGVGVELKLGAGCELRLDNLISSRCGNAPFHLHGSPPCQNLSVANTDGDRNKGLRLVDWFIDYAERSGAASWSLEQVPTIGGHLWQRGIPFEILNAADFGAPTTRRRIFAGRGYRAARTHEPAGWGVVKDALTLRDTDDLWLNMDGCAESDSRRARSAERQVNKPAMTIRGNRPTLRRRTDAGWVKGRALRVDEMLTLQGFRSDYDMSAADRADEVQMVANTVCPPVAAAIAGGRLHEIETLAGWVHD